MTTELPVAPLRSLLLSMELLGHDASGVFSRLRSLRNRGGWEDLVSALEDFFEAEGGASMQRLVQAVATRSAAVALATELLVDPRQTFLVLLEAAAARQSVVGVSVRSHPGGLTVHLELHKGARPSLTFFRACVWFLAAVPRARGLADARVVPEKLSERELLCEVIPPADSGGLRLMPPDSVIRLLARELFPHDPPPVAARVLPTAQMLQERFGLTRAEARVVRRLAEGRSIKRIAEALRVSPETARTHAKRAMQKTDTHRQAELVSLVLQSER
jgi:DNA-binding CsgD family transcriptional regulator